MPNNDVVLLADMLERDRLAFGGTVQDHDTFFTAKHYLRKYFPTPDDLLSGLVDGGQDGGIDGIYVFAGSACLRDEVSINGLSGDAELDLLILQVKNSRSFGEDAINRLLVTLPKILDFSRDEADLAKSLNPRVLEVSRRFLKAYRALDMPKLRVFLAFASLRAEHLHPNTAARAPELGETVRRCFSSASVETVFLDASALADMVRDRPQTTRELILAENPISTSTAGGYVAVVRLSDYEDFITDDQGKLDASLFEANVRDYEGDTSVNRSIHSTLSRPEAAVDFWWLNNGVTVVAEKVEPAGKLLKLKAPQIVNGLQTSNEIYKARKVAELDEGDVRSVLVKVIQAADETVRDRIIRATNSQTSFGPSALRATDRVQRQIEEHLATRGLFYERRRRHYYNQGKPVESLVSIDQMGQAVLAVLVQAPQVARGEVSRVFEEDLYDLIFAPGHPIQMYGVAIDILRRSYEHLNQARHTRAQAEDFVYHLAMLNGMAMTRKHRPVAADLVSADAAVLTKKVQTSLLEGIQKVYARVGRFTGQVTLDNMAKDPAVTAEIRDFGKNYLGRGVRA